MSGGFAARGWRVSLGAEWQPREARFMVFNHTGPNRSHLGSAAHRSTHRRVRYAVGATTTNAHCRAACQRPHTCKHTVPTSIHTVYPRSCIQQQRTHYSGHSRRLVGWSFTVLRFCRCCMHTGRGALIDMLHMHAGGTQHRVERAPHRLPTPAFSAKRDHRGRHSQCHAAALPAWPACAGLTVH